MKALSQYSLILLAGIWMLGGCVQVSPRIGQPTPPRTTAAEPGAPAAPASAGQGPGRTLTALARAVDAQDMEAVKAAFAPPYRPALQQWAESAGVPELMRTLTEGLAASRDASAAFNVVRYTGDGQVRWESRAATWDEAAPVVQAAIAEPANLRVEIEHRGFTFAPYSGMWLFERW